jgi:3-deoxy-D-manno-octulosonic-acid transferase
MLLVDTLGELRSFYAGSDVAIVGGTFHDHGGHNLMEPAVYGIPIVFGPDTSSWPEDAEALLAAGGGQRAADAVSLVAIVMGYCSDWAAAARAGERARAAVEAQRGASRRILAALDERGFW